ncbi:chorismate synthase [Vagococcus lutrae]|uniref:chorismate synthase n=1 Tax=Vagococcus lutrae TaxID=81947 RepID=UPI00200E9458|nr:chorismate synthase [Vagococcus lutrae]UQF23667.1 chorismate synthase [Vagococcus lutrae]UQF39006.1 chorismate synthase [Vagococcus lutrae]UQF64245.1 chorismate synthase [Vagococcus lutrae]
MRFLTAGESHGQALTTIIEGMPAGMAIDVEAINHELWRRQQGYGRGNRMKIESDRVNVLSGVRHGYTLGSPITLQLLNKDYDNWQSVMGIEPVSDMKKKKRRVTKPRPGHADLAGGMKYQHADLRNVLERSSARETAMRVAVGAIAKQFLSQLNIEVLSHVVAIGPVMATYPKDLGVSDINKAQMSPVFCVDEQASTEMMHVIDEAKQVGDTLGGKIEIKVYGVPAGIGSYVHWDRKLDGQLAGALMSINAFKGVEFGDGFLVAHQPGSQVMDEIYWDEANGFYRGSNHLGGLEGGMTNGMPLTIKTVMKPIPTLYRPLNSVDIETKEAYKATVERSDACAVPAASVVAEGVVATVLAQAILSQYSNDTMAQVKKAMEEANVRHHHYLKKE